NTTSTPASSSTLTIASAPVTPTAEPPIQWIPDSRLRYRACGPRAQPEGEAGAVTGRDVRARSTEPPSSRAAHLRPVALHFGVTTGAGAPAGRGRRDVPCAR